MAKFLACLFFGLIFTLIPVAILLSGVMESYLKYHGIAVYFNPYFAYAINGWVFLGVSIVVGYLMLFSIGSTVFRALYIVIFLMSISAYTPMIGQAWGVALFHKPEVELSLEGGKKVSAEVLYEGREAIYYRLHGEMRIEKLEKSHL